MGAALVFEDVSKVYPAASGGVALDGVRLSVSPGEFIAVLGPSGCGKSTLLHLSGGIDVATAGRVLADGRDVGRLAERDLTLYRRRSVGVVFQFFNLIPALTVLENVELPLALDGQRHAGARARELLDRVGLAEKAGAHPWELSGGQMQRVALARALVHRPRLLLLDEPLGALDALTRIEMQQLIESLWRTHGFTALLVTHDVSEAVALADRVVLIEDHRIALDERVALGRPRSRGQAAFAALEDRLLQRVLREPARPDGEVAAPLPGIETWRWAI